MRNTPKWQFEWCLYCTLLVVISYLGSISVLATDAGIVFFKLFNEVTSHFDGRTSCWNPKWHTCWSQEKNINKQHTSICININISVYSPRPLLPRFCTRNMHKRDIELKGREAADQETGLELENSTRQQCILLVKHGKATYFICQFSPPKSMYSYWTNNHDLYGSRSKGPCKEL
jgi:hypothetical protein